MKYLLFFSILATTILFSACGDVGLEEFPADYRVKWVGSYEGTKSNTSFDDDMFVTDLSFEVRLDPDSDDGLFVKDILLPVSEDGTFGPDVMNGGFTNYELTIEDDELRLSSFANFPNGIALPCFIKARKI